MCVNIEEIMLIDRFIIDMGMLSYPADFPVGNFNTCDIYNFLLSC